MKKVLLVLAVGLALVGGGFWTVRQAGHGLWERTLDGPFVGRPFAGSITTRPSSHLDLPGRGRLEVHELSPPTNPLVIWRSFAGEVQWARLLVPEREREGHVEQAGLRDLRLLRSEDRSTGSVVVISCDWDWGGKEGGLIDLDRDHGFKSFRLSW